jgi:hypothetical protein
MDDYEGVASTGDSADDDPVARQGAWLITEPTDKHVQVLADPATPRAAQGKHFLKTADAPGATLVTNAQMTFAPQTTVGDVIHWESMVYVPSGQTLPQPADDEWKPSVMNLFAGSGAGAANLHLHILPSGDIFRFYGKQIDTGLDFQPDTWQKWEIDYRVNRSAFTLTVDGNSATVFMRSAAPVVDTFRYAPDEGGVVYFDAVPADYVPTVRPKTREMSGLRWASGEWSNTLKPTGKPAASLKLAAGGQTDYVIVIPNAPTPQDRKAAEDLALWLGEMTGATFPIVADSEAARETEISIGQTNRLDQANVPEAGADLGDDGYAIGVEGKKLYLLGGRKRGPINTVYALLEEGLGCRWYPPLNMKDGLPRPEPTANRIPRIPSLSFHPVPRSYVPPFMYRAPGYVNAYETAWALRNRIHGAAPEFPEEWGGDVNWRDFAHEMGRLVPASDYFEKHPEYYSLIDGKRAPKQLCMTNAEVIRVLTENLRSKLVESPHVEFADVSPNDGGGHCTCAECTALNEENGSPSGSQIHFVNQVAQGLEKEFPGVKLVTAAYMDSHKAPTKIRARKNVAIFLANDAHSWVKPLVPFTTAPWDISERYRQAIVGWGKASDTVLVWDYFTNFQHFLAPMPNLHVLEPSVRFYEKHNVKGIYMQGGYIAAGEFYPMRAWVIAKLLWDPSRSVDELIKDFILGYYREAAPAIAEYRALLDRVSVLHRNDTNSICFSMTNAYPYAVFLTRQYVDQATVIFDRVLEMPLSPEVRRRVQVARLPITYVKLCKGGTITDEPWFFQTGEDYTALLEGFKAIVDREKIRFIAEGKPIAGWLAEKEAVYGRLPENVVYDLYQNLGSARTENCRMFKRTSVDQDGKTLLCILEHPPGEGVGEATYKIPLPAPENGKKLVLQFGTCFSKPT